MLLCHIQRSASGARQRSRVPSLSHSPFLAEPLLPIRQIYTEMTLLHVKTMTSQFFFPDLVEAEPVLASGAEGSPDE